MLIKVTRNEFTNNTTIGGLSINGKWICYTCEDKDRGLNFQMLPEEIRQIKVYGKTAIPYGTYDLIINMSNRFQRELPLLLNVPGFEGIRIHAGNTSEDTHGCILLGNARGLDAVYESRAAMNLFMTILKKAIDEKEEITITIH